MDFSTEDKMKCVQRELVLRRNVYPVRVRQRKMKQAQADREIAIMQAIHADYALLLSVEQFKQWRESKDTPSNPPSGKSTTSAARQRAISTKSSRRVR